MSIHINAPAGAIAETVLLPGDPMRAKYIAEHFLEDATCYNDVRGMLGYTGTYKGHRISIQGTGMGMPSASIYLTELIQSYGVKKAIRIGTCGSLREDVHVRDVIIAQSASTSSAMMDGVFGNYRYAPTANFDLLHTAYQKAQAEGIPVHVGNVVSDDVFYKDDISDVLKLGAYGTLGIEMETAAVYFLGAKFGIEALALLTVSDHMITGEETSSEEREKTFNQMVEIALETAIM